MKIEEFKDVLTLFLGDLINQWFDGKGFNELMLNSGLKTIIKANRNKYDGIINLFTDEKGNVMINDILTNIDENIIGDGLTIDVREFGKQYLGELSSLLPPKILIFGKNDLNQLKNMLK